MTITVYAVVKVAFSQDNRWSILDCEAIDFYGDRATAERERDRLNKRHDNHQPYGRAYGIIEKLLTT